MTLLTTNPIAGVVIGLAMGIVFGFALEKSRVFEPGVLVTQMQLKSFLMLKVFLAALITGLVIIAVMHGVFEVPLHLKPLVLGADVIGGLLLGAGIVIAGACPGTMLAQIGAGYRDAWFTLAGGIAGAIVYGYNDKAIQGFIADTPAKITLDGALGLPFWGVALGLAALLAVGVWLIELVTPWRSEVGDDVDGVTPTARTAPTSGQETGHAGSAGRA